MKQRAKEGEASYHIHSGDSVVTSGTLPCQTLPTGENKGTAPNIIVTTPDFASNTLHEEKLSIEQPIIYKSLKDETRIAIKRHEETLKELAKH